MADEGLTPGQRTSQLELPLTGGRSADGGAMGTAERLIALCGNERFAPEILPYPADEVTTILDKIAAQNVVIAQLTEDRKAKVATEGVSLVPFRAEDLYRLEVQRLQYLVSDLLRLRLRKIQHYATAIAHSPDDYAAILSPNELVVAQRMAELVQQAVHDGGLRLLPEQLRFLRPNPPYAEGPECLPAPALDEYIFAMPLEPFQFKLDDVDTEKNAVPGEVWMMPYRNVRPFLMSGQMRLV